jgi:hypothetical protein
MGHCDSSSTVRGFECRIDSHGRPYPSSKVAPLGPTAPAQPDRSETEATRRGARDIARPAVYERPGRRSSGRQPPRSRWELRGGEENAARQGVGRIWTNATRPSRASRFSRNHILALPANTLLWPAAVRPSGPLATTARAASRGASGAAPTTGQPARAPCATETLPPRRHDRPPDRQ